MNYIDIDNILKMCVRKHIISDSQVTGILLTAKEYILHQTKDCDIEDDLYSLAHSIND